MLQELKGRADWGMIMKPDSRAFCLAFLTFAEQNYDLHLVTARRNWPPVSALLDRLESQANRWCA